MSEFRIPRSNLQVEVANRLREEIVAGHWRPGERLPERLLCERYGISRPPLREAYQSLIAEGLLKVWPNRGAVVTAPTADGIMQHFELLRALELLGVRLACRHAGPQELDAIEATDRAMAEAVRCDDAHGFLRLNNLTHRLIIEAGGNVPLADAHLVTSRQIIRVQNLHGGAAHLAPEAMHEHEEIVAALIARDEERTATLFAEHLDTVEGNLRQRLQEFDRAA